jgi:hypothetical protein
MEWHVVSETKRGKPEYLEGPEATERFEKGMRILFQIPKYPPKNKKQKEKPTASRKKRKSRGNG